jgi:hypothetical protein
MPGVMLSSPWSASQASKSSWWRRMPGDLANAVNLVVANHIVSHVWLDTYLLRTNEVGPSAEKTFGCAMVEFGPVTTAAISQIGERQ